MRMRIPLVAVLALFVAVSCDQQPAAPQADQVAEAPVFNFANGPEYPGKSPLARSHFDDECLWCESNDPASDLYAIHYEAWENYCNGAPELTAWDYQENTHDRQNYNAQARDQALYIYDWSDLFDAFIAGELCPFLADGWLYQGTHDMNFNGSWSADFSKGHDQMMGTGLVYDHADNPYTYTEKQKYVKGKGWTHEYIIFE